MTSAITIARRGATWVDGQNPGCTSTHRYSALPAVGTSPSSSSCGAGTNIRRAPCELVGSLACRLFRYSAPGCCMSPMTDHGCCCVACACDVDNKGVNLLPSPRPSHSADPGGASPHPLSAQGRVITRRVDWKRSLSSKIIYKRGESNNDPTRTHGPPPMRRRVAL